MNRTTVANFIKSDTFPKILIGIGIALGIIVVFEAGVLVGHRQAAFSAHWGANYQQNFGPRGAGIGMDDHEPLANGALGKIMQVASSSIVIANQNNQEQRVTIDSDTIIRDHENAVASSSLSVGTYVVVVGEPNDHGEIDARLIRVVPAPTAQPQR